MTDPVRKTPLNDLHHALKARMTAFAGYEMPLQYEMGILAEHLHVRRAAGLFDISHMGQVRVRARSGGTLAAAGAVERLVPIDVLGLPPGRQRYGFFTNATGGILDDIMVANRGGHILIVVNAACKEADTAHLTAELSDCTVTLDDSRALLALQGPKAEAALAALAPAAVSMRFMDVADLLIAGVSAVVSRSGYTGEDGYEISVPAESAVAVAEALLAQPDVKPIGLGARDSLRLEAGLCLYGADIDQTTTPIEAGLTWAIQKVRHAGGDRAAGFPGADRILGQIATGVPRRRVGLRPEGRAPVRGGAPLFANAADSDPIGTVTSGGFGPSVDAPVAMGYVPTPLAATGTRLFAEVRGKRLPVDVAPLPFFPHRFKRG